jgi:hypothetical protein
MGGNEPSGATARLRGAIVAGVVVLVGVVGLALFWASGRGPSAASGDPAGAPSPSGATAPGVAGAGPSAVGVADAPPAAQPPEDPLHQPGSAAAAHAAIAEELGLVGIRCRLPPGVPTGPPIGLFRPRVVDGWLSDVVYSREGERPADFPVEPGPGAPEEARPRFETAYYVSWKASRFGESVPCVVRPVERGTLVLTLVDDEGEPVDGVDLRACGRSGTTQVGHLELDDVLAGEPCTVQGTRVTEDGVCTVREAVTVPAGGTATVEVALRCAELLDVGAIDVLSADFEDLREAVRPEAAYTLDEEAEIALFRRLRAQVEPGSEAAALYDDLIRHREERIGGRPRKEELLQLLRSRDPAVHDAALEELRRMRPY